MSSNSRSKASNTRSTSTIVAAPIAKKTITTVSRPNVKVPEVVVPKYVAPVVSNDDDDEDYDGCSGFTEDDEKELNRTIVAARQAGYDVDDEGNEYNEVPEEVPVVKAKSAIPNKKSGMRSKATGVAIVGTTPNVEVKPPNEFTIGCYDEYTILNFCKEFSRPDGLRPEDGTLDEFMIEVRRNMARVICYLEPEHRYYVKVRKTFISPPEYTGEDLSEALLTKLEQIGTPTIYYWTPDTSGKKGTLCSTYTERKICVKETTGRGKLSYDDEGNVIKGKDRERIINIPLFDKIWIVDNLAKSNFVTIPYVYGTKDPARREHINMFPGFPWKPLDDDDIVPEDEDILDEFLDKIRDGLCCEDLGDTTGSESYLFWFMCWFMFPFISGMPTRKGVIITGEEGTMKSMLMRFFARLMWGSRMSHTVNLNQLTCDFNSEYIGKWFITCEEANSTNKNYRSDMDLLKEIVTGETASKKTKTVANDEDEVLTNINLSILSNAGSPIRIDNLGDRRYFVLKGIRREAEFYNRMAKLMSYPRLPALLYAWAKAREVDIRHTMRYEEKPMMTSWKKELVRNVNSAHIDANLAMFDITDPDITGSQEVPEKDYHVSDKYIAIRVNPNFEKRYGVKPDFIVTTLNSLDLGFEACIKKFSWRVVKETFAFKSAIVVHRNEHINIHKTQVLNSTTL